MLRFKKTKFGIRYAHIWFGQKPRLTECLSLCAYLQCKHDGTVPGFVRRSFTTKLIDLGQPAESLLKGMNDSTAYKIRRGRRDGLTLKIVESLDQFLDFYNAFAESKKRGKLTALEIDGWGKHSLAFAAMKEDTALAMHSYIVDASESRARLLHSASLFRQFTDSARRNEISRANCWLHFETMLHFKEMGLANYDLGGFAASSTDPDLVRIATFKAGFGGTEVVEANYYSLPMLALQNVNRLSVRSGKADDEDEMTGPAGTTPRPASETVQQTPPRMRTYA
jgi:hypothetical protein